MFQNLDGLYYSVGLPMTVLDFLCKESYDLHILAVLFLLLLYLYNIFPYKSELTACSVQCRIEAMIMTSEFIQTLQEADAKSGKHARILPGKLPMKESGEGAKEGLEGCRPM